MDHNGVSFFLLTIFGQCSCFIPPENTRKPKVGLGPSKNLCTISFTFHMDFSNTIITLKGSHRRCSIEKGVLKNFAKFTGKQLYQSLFFNNKDAGLRPPTLWKKGLWHRCFPVNFAKFLRTVFRQNTSRRLLLSTADCPFRRPKEKRPTFRFHSLISKLLIFCWSHNER